MKRLYIISLSLLIGSTAAFAQGSVEAMLREIELNNPELRASAAALDEERIANHSEALLEDPELEFNYLWGGAGIGNRHDVRFTQSIDIPTLSGMKSGKAADLDVLASLKDKALRLEVLQEARMLCIDIIYHRLLLQELKDHLERSVTLVRSYEKRIDAGGSTILDLNKAKLHSASIQGKIAVAQSELQSSLSRLRSMNGGKDPVTELTAYDMDEILPQDFDTWFAEAAEKNPVLGYIRQEVAVGERQLAIDKVSMMPSLTVGYMSEIRTEEKFRGMTVGVSIPLWSGANKVKRSRAGVVAAESRRDAAETEFYDRLRDMYRKASSLKDNAEMMRRSLVETDYRDFMVSALSRGEISMVDYLVENDLYFEALEQTLAAERDYRYSLAALKLF